MAKGIANMESLKKLLTSQHLGQSAGFYSNNIVLIDNISARGFIDYNRSDFFAYFLCTSGSCRLNLNFQDYEIHKGSLITILPNLFFQMTDFSEDCTGKLLVVENDILEDSIVKIANLLDLFLFIMSHPHVQLDEEEERVITAFCDAIFNRIGNEEKTYHKEVSKHLLIAAFYEVCSIFSHRQESAPVECSRQVLVFEQFFYDLLLHFREEHDISFYSDKIGITPKYLSSISKQVSGRLASEWIREFLVAEAKVMLKNTDMPIRRISLELHFPSQSYFGRFFSRYVGKTPKEFRGLQ